KYMLEYNPRAALGAIWGLVTQANQKIEEKKPWVLAKDPNKKQELEETLVMLAEWLAHIACLLQPLLPETARQILTRLCLAPEIKIKEGPSFAERLLAAGAKIERGEALFPKL